MRLWTLQTKDFKIESEATDFSKSSYYNDTENLPNIQKAYQKLFSEIQEKPFLWCFMHNNFYRESDKLLYELEVPEEEIIAYICGCVWHKIITNCKRFDNHDCRKYWPGYPVRDVEQQNQRCFSQESESQLWERLFWPKATKITCPAGILIPDSIDAKFSMYSALIKSPVKSEWVIKKERLNAK